jgi:hypothetical protein
MSVHEKIDKTKKNIGVTGLNEREKKDLFNKFVDAGGKVVNEKTRRALADFDREKQKQIKTKIESHRQKLQASAPARRIQQPASPGSKSYSPSSPGRIMRFWQRWKIRFRLYFSGVTDLYGLHFKPGFLERMNTDYKSALIEIQLVYLDVLKKNPAIGRSITDELDSSNPVYIELMEMVAAVFDRTLLTQIVEGHSTFPDVIQSVSELRIPLMALLKKLYILYSYREFLAFAFEKTINIQMRLEKKKAGEYSVKKKKINNSISLVYYRLFYSLYWLMCNYAGKVIPLMDPEMDRYLGISDDERPGKRKKRILAQKADEQAEKENQKEVEDKKSPEVPDHVKIGLRVMSRLDMEQLQNKYEVDKHFKVIYSNDKVLTTFLLFQEFDEEYSFILTTNKIKYNVVFTPEGKIDFRMRLLDLYNGLRKCIPQFKDYAEIMEAREKTKSERPTSNAQYIDFSKRIQEMEKRRTASGKTLRRVIYGFMEKCITELKVLIDDMNDQQKIVENPQEELHFEQSIEGIKKVQGRKIYEAINAAYCYASAFLYRLDDSGDLSGELDFKEGEGPLLVADEHDEAEKTDSEKKPKKTKESEEEDSIIRELDDLL